MKKDPVCGMDVTPETAAACEEHGGVTYCFCSTHCRDAFRREPERYLGGTERSEREAR